MTTCPDISMLLFSPPGKVAINKIRQIQRTSKLLSTILGVSPLLEIFVGNGALGGAYNISKKDWGTWANAMRVAPNVKSRRIEDVARRYLVDNLSLRGKEQTFWIAVAHGCR